AAGADVQRVRDDGTAGSRRHAGAGERGIAGGVASVSACGGCGGPAEGTPAISAAALGGGGGRQGIQPDPEQLRSGADGADGDDGAGAAAGVRESLGPAAGAGGGAAKGDLDPAGIGRRPGETAAPISGRELFFGRARRSGGVGAGAMVEQRAG